MLIFFKQTLLKFQAGLRMKPVVKPKEPIPYLCSS